MCHLSIVSVKSLSFPIKKAADMPVSAISTVIAFVANFFLFLPHPKINLTWPFECTLNSQWKKVLKAISTGENRNRIFYSLLLVFLLG